MIDIESELYTIIRDALVSKFPNITVSGLEERMPPSFPFVSIVEADNTTRTDTIDSGSFENHANVMYEVNVYSNKTNGRKSEAKAILAEIDFQLITRGFARTSSQAVSMDSASLYRLVTRYVAAVSKDKVIYRR